MFSAAGRWLGRIPATDPFERRTAIVVQAFCIGLGAWLLFGNAVRPLLHLTNAPTAADVLADGLAVAFSLAAVVMIRRGQARAGYALVIGSYVAILALSLVFRGLEFHRLFFVRVFAVLLVLPALLLGRRALWTALGVLLAAMLAGHLRDLGYLGGHGPNVPTTPPLGLWRGSVVIMVLLSLVLDRFGAALTEAYASALQRQREAERVTRELRAAKESLEAEMERRVATEALLYQSQKLEAIGRLSGGVAHDFNNLLTAILGFADLASASCPPDDARRDYLEGVMLAARRGAGLTRQMLAFARRQIVQPVALRVEDRVRGIEPMLRRLIGENVRIELALDADPVTVLIDPVQLEQVLVNLAVNARDAMPRGGTLRIETGQVVLAPGAAGGPDELKPGRHARLVVSDNGEGMDAQTLASAFEPFFTTKAVGKGTGLGLATCYGIIRQAGGSITPSSAPGRGTTFEILLPASDPVAAAPEAATPRRPSGGSETILVVEDDPQVLDLVVGVLDTHGYTTLVASCPAEAEALARSAAQAIDLLLTDVLLPGTDGRRLAAALGRMRPDLRTVYMSGHSDDIIARHGALDPGIELLSKPFTPDELLGKVRVVLDRRTATA